MGTSKFRVVVAQWCFLLLGSVRRRRCFALEEFSLFPLGQRCLKISLAAFAPQILRDLPSGLGQ